MTDLPCSTSVPYGKDMSKDITKLIALVREMRGTLEEIGKRALGDINFSEAAAFGVVSETLAKCEKIAKGGE
jgi:hypothetical protein